MMIHDQWFPMILAGKYSGIHDGSTSVMILMVVIDYDYHDGSLMANYSISWISMILVSIGIQS